VSKRLCADVQGLTVVITIHFQDRWDERIGEPLVLPVDRVVTTFKRLECGEYRTRLVLHPKKPCLVIGLEPTSLSFITVVLGPYNGSLCWIPLREAA
jgi:hypothetical protein